MIRYLHAAVLMMIVLTPAAHTQAAEYFVSLTGDDANDGRTRSAAFASVQKGVDELQPGDTLTILPGEYFGGVRRDKLGGPDATTTIRAAIPGTVVLRGDVPCPEFRLVPGYRFVYAADFDHDGDVHVVNEWDTLTIFEGLPNVPQLEFSPGSFHYDREAGRLYVSTKDLRPPLGRKYTVSVTGSQGLYLSNARRVVIEGVGVTGFNTNSRMPRRDRTMAAVYGMFLYNSKDCVIRDCLAYMNGQGIGVSSEADASGDNLVERCRAWSNGSQFGDGDRGGITLHGRRIGSRDVIRDCVSFRNQQYGINIYSGYGERKVDPSNRNKMIDNLAWGNFCDFKIKTGYNDAHDAVRCTGPGLWSLLGPDHCLMGKFTREFTPDNIALNHEEDLDMNREFADPVNHDYRLQAISRFRGTGPDGSDRGPHPYEPNIYYVTPNGDDGGNGLSIEQAWRTLSRASDALQTGDTLYIEPGEYAGRLKLSALENVDIRGRGLGGVVIAGGLEIVQGDDLRFERVSFTGPVAVHESRNVVIRNGSFGAEVNSQGGSGLRIEHCVFDDGSLKVVAGKDLFIRGNVFAGRDPAVVLDAAATVRYADYNSYPQRDEVWSVAGKLWSFDQLRKQHGRYSVVVQPMLDKYQGAPRIGNRAAMVASGPHGTMLGRHTFIRQDDEDLRLAGPFVHSVTDSTANLEWWASGPTQCHLAWGETDTMANRLSIDAHRAGSFSLTGLKPGTRYFVRLTLDEPIRRILDDGTVAEPVASVTMTFTTADAPTPPRVYHVAPDGDNANSGLSRAQAWRTVSHAADRVRPGDTVLIAGGTYNESVRIRTTGERERPITFKATPGEKVVFDGLDRTLGFGFFAQNKKHLRFDGIYFTGLVMASDVMPWADRTRANAGAFALYRTEDVHLTRCFSDGRGQGYPPGLVIAEHCRDTLVKNCVIIRAMGGGISFASSPNFRIENNVFLMNLISNVSEAMNRPDQRFYMVNNILTDNIHAKKGVPFFSIGRIESMIEADNCYHLRRPDEERRMFMFYNGPAYYRAAAAYNMTTDPARPPLFEELTRMSLAEYQQRFNPLSHSFVAAPGFAGAVDMPEVNSHGNKSWSFEYLQGKPDLDFPHLFATHSTVVERGIGLQPEAFADFHFNR